MLSAIDAPEDAVQKLGLFHKVHLPKTRVSKKSPLVVLVHGRAGNANVMWVFSRALEKLPITPIVVSPQAPNPDPIGGFSWWDVNQSGPANNDPQYKLSILAPAVTTLEHFIQKLPEVYEVDPTRIIAFGFSMGAGLLGVLSLQYPTLLQGVALLSGFIPRVVHDQPNRVNPELDSEKTKLPPYFIFHGTKDEVLPFSRAIETKERLESLGARVTFSSDEVGHKVSSKGINALSSWLETNITW